MDASTSTTTEPAASADLVPDLDTARQFLATLFDDSNPTVCFQVFDDSPGKRKHLARYWWATLDEALPDLQKSQVDGAGVFVAINHIAVGESRLAQNVTAARALFIDVDGTAPLPTTWKLAPSIIVQRDATHWHAYWLLSETEPDLAGWKAAQLHLAEHFNSDRSVSLPNQVMRLPGFWHQKNMPVLVGLVENAPARQYAIGEVLAAHPVSETVKKAQRDKKESGAQINEGPINVNRHRSLVRLAGQLARNKDMTEGEARAALSERAKRCSREIPPDEMDGLLKSWRIWAGKVGDDRDQAARLIEEISDLAEIDPIEATMLAYESGDIYAGVTAADFASLKLQLKEILGSSLDKNQLGTIRTDAAKKARADELRKKVQAVGLDTPILDHRDPVRSARELVNRSFRRDGVVLLRRHGGEFWGYEGTCYEARSQEWIRSRIYPFLEAAKVVGGDGPVDFQPTAAHVDNVYDALRSLEDVYLSQCSAPCWIGRGPPPFSPENIVAFKNGLLDLEQWQKNPTAPLMAHTPEWFSAYALPFAYQADAVCPTWNQCLLQWFDGDEESVLALSLIVGLLLTTDTSFQKIFILLGPPRSGKGSIGRALHALLGSHNVCGPTLNSLAGEFGLAPLIGKSLAFIGDAHAGRSTDAAVVLDRLKSISGEDAVSINRKHKEAVTLRLPTRFVIALNKLIDFPDPSGAMAARLIILKTRTSFLGREDRDLDAKLEAELPGIANWALRGLAELRRRGRLLQPASSASEVTEFHRASSPIHAFVEDYCICPAPGSVDVSTLYQAWRVWCLDEGHQAGSKATLGSKLSSAYPDVAIVRPRDGDVRGRRYAGISLTERGQRASARGVP